MGGGVGGEGWGYILVKNVFSKSLSKGQEYASYQNIVEVQLCSGWPGLQCFLRQETLLHVFSLHPGV